MWLLSYSDVVNRHDNFLSYCPKHRRPFEKVKSSPEWSENFAQVLTYHGHLSPFFLCIFSPLLSLNTSIRLPATLTVASAGGRLVLSIWQLLAVGPNIMLNVSRFVMLLMLCLFKVLMWLLTVGPSIMLNVCRFVIVGLNVVVDVDLQSVDVVVDCGAKHFAQCLQVYFMLTTKTTWWWCCCLCWL